jgi:hypothetical protein
LPSNATYKKSEADEVLCFKTAVELKEEQDKIIDQMEKEFNLECCPMNWPIGLSLLLLLLLFLFL